MRAVNAGAVVLAGVVALNVGNYLFHLISARELGPARYGDLAALVALSGLIALPLGGVQLWIAREVARYRARGDDAGAQWFVRRVMTYAAAGGAAATLLLLLAAPLLREALGIASIAAVALTALTTLPAATAQVTWGLAQGLQRFKLIALTYAAGAAARVGLTIAAFAVGLRVGGAMLATLASMLIALAIPLWLLRAWLRRTGPAVRRVTRGEAAHSLAPVVVGLLAMTILTTVDVVVAKAVLEEREAGIYGSASLVGRVILYVPAAIITVLLPRVAARAAGQRDTRDILRRSTFVTVAFCLATTTFYAVAGGPLVEIAFGADYADAADLLWRFGIAMTGFALLNVLLVYHLGHERSRFAWLLLAGAGAQITAFLFFHADARQLVHIDIGVAFALLVAHELMTHGHLARTVVRRRLLPVDRRVSRGQAEEPRGPDG
jgi:O-antigen/teichoic acid export membrane protein